MRLIAALVVIGFGGTLAVMGVFELLLRLGTPATFLDQCTGWRVATACYHAKNVAWAVGFGGAGFAVLVSFYLRAPEWTRWSVVATALAWVPYMAFHVPAVWGRVTLVDFLVYSANVIVLCLVAAPLLWWARRVMTAPPPAAPARPG